MITSFQAHERGLLRRGEFPLDEPQRYPPVAVALAAQRLTKDLRDTWRGLYIVLFNLTVSPNQAQTSRCYALRSLIDGRFLGKAPPFRLMARV